MTKISDRENSEVMPPIFGAIGALTLGLVAGLSGKGMPVTILVAMFAGSAMYLLTRDWE